MTARHAFGCDPACVEWLLAYCESAARAAGLAGMMPKGGVLEGKIAQVLDAESGRLLASAENALRIEREALRRMLRLIDMVPRAN